MRCHPSRYAIVAATDDHFAVLLQALADRGIRPQLVVPRRRLAAIEATAEQVAALAEALGECVVIERDVLLDFHAPPG